MSRRVLLITPFLPFPAYSGAASRSAAIVAALEAAGCEVHVAYLDRGRQDDGPARRRLGSRFHPIAYRLPRRPGWLLKQAASRVGHRLPGLVRTAGERPYLYGVDDWFGDSLRRALLALASSVRFDAVAVQYVFYSKAFECFEPDALKVLDTCDVFGYRHRPCFEARAPYTWFSTTFEEEARGLDRADVVVAIQPSEAEVFSRLTRRRVVTVGHIASLHAHPPPPPGEPRMLFVGTRSPHNVDALGAFVREALPRIRARVPGARLAVAGEVGASIPAADGCDRLGRVDDLGELYASAAVVVNPARIGTGLKIKSLEALGHGRPLVTTPVGAEGIGEGAGDAFLVGHGTVDVAERVVDVLSDAALAERLSRRGRSFVERLNRENVRALEQLFA